jgi:chromosome segregation ATPase
MTIPSVIQGTVEVEGKVFELDSPKGAAWLETIGSFRFEPSGDSKPCTIRREPSGYWYGCRKVAGKVRKKYIGKSSEVSIVKLEEIAEALEVPPVPRVNKVAEVAQEVAQDTQVTEKVAQVAEDRLTALELEVANLRKALEALQEALPGKSEAGDSAELPKVDNAVAEELQNELGNLKAENEYLRQKLAESRDTVETLNWGTEALKEQLEAVRAENQRLQNDLGNSQAEVIQLRSQLETEKARGEEIWEELSDTEQVLAEVRSENSEQKKTCAELRSQLEKERADRKEIEAELAEVAQLKKEVKEHAHELHREENSMKLEKVRWQRELSDARAELADAKATILNQGNKIRELERGYSLKPSPAESRLRLEIGNLQAELAELKQKSAAASKDLPEAAEILNQLKSKRKKSKTDLADLEIILEILES